MKIRPPKDLQALEKWRRRLQKVAEAATTVPCRVCVNRNRNGWVAARYFVRQPALRLPRPRELIGGGTKMPPVA